MDHPSLDQLARLLAQGGSRRWVVKALAAGGVSGGVLTHGAQSTVAKGRSNNFAEQQHHCRVTERDCAARCSNAAL